MQRRYLMCPPTYFDVVYSINPWMDPAQAVDHDEVTAQWAALRAAYGAHGHQVELIEPGPGLPDMVFAANSALVLDGVAYLARFQHAERRGEESLYAQWFEANGFTVQRAAHVHEGEGDFAVAGDVILAGTGFRTDRAAHDEVARVFGREVVSLRLVDPRFYHLDTALFVLDDARIAYFPGAFDADSRRELQRRYPDAFVADEVDAVAFGLNATSDGHAVFLPAAAKGLAKRVADAGYEPIPIALTETIRAGGSVKCCTLELRS
jgi:N-dimethylarginine dimethylaminohydrolase